MSDSQKQVDTSQHLPLKEICVLGPSLQRTLTDDVRPRTPTDHISNISGKVYEPEQIDPSINRTSSVSTNGTAVAVSTRLSAAGQLAGPCRAVSKSFQPRENGSVCKNGDSTTDFTARVSESEEQKLLRGDEDPDEEDIAPADALRIPLWKIYGTRIFLWAMSSVLVGIGSLLQTLKHTSSSTGLQQMYRWFYFVGVVYPLWSISVFVSYRVFSLVEWLMFEEALYFLATLAQPVRWMLLFTLLLPAHVLIFKMLWCDHDVCNVPEFRTAHDISWRILVCLLLLSIVNFTKNLAAKLLSHHFYRTSYLAKVQDALEKEYYLMSLSQDHDVLEGRRNEEEKRKLERQSRVASHMALTDLDKESMRVNVAMDSRDDDFDKIELLLHMGSTCAQTPRSSVQFGVQFGEEPSIHKAASAELSSDAKRTKAKHERCAASSAAALARMRRGVYMHTYTHLLRRARISTKQEEEQNLLEARKLGKDIFNNVIGQEDRNYVIQDDFELFFNEEGMAAKAFRVFDRDGDGRVMKPEVKAAVEEIYKDRKNMAATLQDTHNIVGSLESVIGCVLYLILFVVVLALWGINVWKGWSTFTASVLALAFVFGNSVKNTFEAALFLLVEHPYDCGDIIDVDGKLWTVGKFDLMYTVLHALTGEKVYYPNTQLMAKTIVNLTTSEGNRNEAFKIQFDLSTPKSVVEDVTKTLEAHMEANQSEFKGKPTVFLVSLANPLKMEMSVWWCFNFPPVDLLRALVARNAILGVLMERLHELGIQCTIPMANATVDAMKLKLA